MARNGQANHTITARLTPSTRLRATPLPVPGYHAAGCRHHVGAYCIRPQGSQTRGPELQRPRSGELHPQGRGRGRVTEPVPGELYDHGDAPVTEGRVQGPKSKVQSQDPVGAYCIRPWRLAVSISVAHGPAGDTPGGPCASGDSGARGPFERPQDMLVSRNISGQQPPTASCGGVGPGPRRVTVGARDGVVGGLYLNRPTVCREEGCGEATLWTLGNRLGVRQ